MIPQKFVDVDQILRGFLSDGSICFKPAPAIRNRFRSQMNKRR